jgi:peptidyl-prolyl cis-trans isomerase D
MLEKMRGNPRNLVNLLFLGIIIVVFVFSFGPGSRGCEGGIANPPYAATVDGITIPAGEFERMYGSQVRRYQQQLGEAFSQELVAQLGLRNAVLNGLVDRELVIREAERHGLTVGDADLEKVVKSMPDFQVDGRFDLKTYQGATTYTYGSPGKYEEELRRNLLYQKMMAALRETVKLSDQEVREGWLAENDKVNLTFVRFNFSQVKAEVKATDAEAEALMAKSPERIEKFYNDNAFRYDKKKRVRARHILIKAEEKAPEAESDAAKKRIEELAARVKGGEDFGKLATENSDDPGSKAKGGDLDFFGEGVMAKPFEEAAFALKPGEISGPVRTRFGWHLIKVEAVEEPKKIPLEEARLGIARELAEEAKADALVRKRAQEALDKVRAGKKLADLFPAPAIPKEGDHAKNPFKRQEKPTAEETGSFGASNDFVPKLGAVAGMAADAIAGNTGQALPKIYELPSAGVVIAQIKERQRPDPAQFEEKKGEFLTRLKNRRQTEVETAWLKELRAKAEVKVNTTLVQGRQGQGGPVDPGS